ncbi:hypothetical protein NKH77_02325 [Streptomyces sp. M19]
MPYLLDHCFFKQPPQADPAEGWPVVPGTTVIGHLMDHAERAVPGLRAVAVHDVRLNQWITAIPAVDIPVHVTPRPPTPRARPGDGRPRPVRAGHRRTRAGPRPERARAGPSRRPRRALRPDRPRAVHPALDVPRPALPGRHRADRDRRRARTRRPDHSARAGALLDNVGQLLGYWIMSRLPTRTTVFPVGMREIRFHGAHPRPASGSTA